MLEINECAKIMPHLFISYAKKDTRELALALTDALNQVSGMTAWVDKSLRAGRSWELQIQMEIDRCDAMVVLYSPDINRHKQDHPKSYVLTEISYAKHTAQKLIIPVMAQQTTPPISLTMEHYIDFTIDNIELSDLVEAICDELDIESSNSHTLSNKKRTSKIYVYSASTNLIPTPFAWVKIPDKNYSIAKYPVTNAQFSVFKNDNGYHNKEWWLQSGWEERVAKDWKSPRYWHDPQWNKATHPVVGVSWHEAIAFSRWLSHKISERVELPTEDQWLYAAQGNDNLPFPWGTLWNADRCNSSAGTTSWGQTSPVTKYENIGDSPFGVVDMLGNVWEWCMDWNNDKKPLRGSCWRSAILTLEKRTERKSILSFNLWGFRLVKYHT